MDIEDGIISKDDFEKEQLNEPQEVNISVEEKCRWQINFFNAYLEEANLLKTGDIIWLNHSEKNCTLAASKDDTFVAPEDKYK